MKIDKALLGNTKAIAVVILVIVILLPVGYSLVTYVIARGSPGTVPFIERPAEKYEKCVRETAYMRFHHWELLQQIRDDVVRNGIRGEIGLKNCRECHPNRERFCNQCHKAVSLYPDCWGCHYYPATPAATEDAAQLDEARLYPRQTTVAIDRSPGK